MKALEITQTIQVSTLLKWQVMVVFENKNKK